MRRLLFFVASVMATGTSTAGCILKHPVDMVPIQIISSGSGTGPVTMLSTSRILPSTSQHDIFIKAITEHVAIRLAEENLCLDSVESKALSLLQFVVLSLHTLENRPSARVQPLDANPSGGCRITSPWIDLAFERKPVPWIRGIVRWNQRQLLADQAILAGAKNVPSGVAAPMKQSEYSLFLEEYQFSELFSKRPEMNPAGKRVQSGVMKPLEERVPPDLLWLLRRSPLRSGHHVPYVSYVDGAMIRASEIGADNYKKLVIALIDRCFAADGTNLKYNSILDVADLLSLEQYKIDTPLY